jgi:MYXO-CTERM domain-containing protein
VYSGAEPALTISFDQEALGGLPTFAGLVWTDGATLDLVRFEAFDSLGHSLGSVEGHLGDSLWKGQTAEDRFFGVSHEGGISSIRLTRAAGGISGFEIDHLQYGHVIEAVPLPPAAVMGLAGLAGAVLLRRRRA